MKFSSRLFVARLQNYSAISKTLTAKSFQTKEDQQSVAPRKHPPPGRIPQIQGNANCKTKYLVNKFLERHKKNFSFRLFVARLPKYLSISKTLTASSFQAKKQQQSLAPRKNPLTFRWSQHQGNVNCKTKYLVNNILERHNMKFSSRLFVAR